MQVASSPSASLLPRLALIIDVAHAHPGRALHLGIVVRDGEAAFLVEVDRSSSERQTISGLTRKSGVLGSSSRATSMVTTRWRLAHLDRCEPDAGGLGHGGEHLIHEAPRVVRYVLDQQALPEDRIGNCEDFKIAPWPSAT